MDYCFVDCIGWNSYYCGYVEFLKMNERIQELAIKAQVEHCVSHVRLQEFAELIVKECADVAKWWTPETEECEYSWLIHNKIKEHFRVE
jgi:hypothetical protein